MIKFNLYTNNDFRKSWKKFLRDEGPRTTGYFNNFMRTTVAEAKAVAPKKTGALREGITCTKRAYLKCTFVTTALRDGVFDYGAYRHENEAINYTTPGTHAFYLQQSFDRNAAILAAKLEREYLRG